MGLHSLAEKNRILQNQKVPKRLRNTIAQKTPEVAGCRPNSTVTLLIIIEKFGKPFLTF